MCTCGFALSTRFANSNGIYNCLNHSLLATDGPGWRVSGSLRLGSQTFAIMESALAPEVTISPDGKLVAFVAHVRGVDVPCSITRVALEEHFWLPAGADGARLMKGIVDGRARIAAVVERKMLRAPAELIKLTGADFRR
jgi:Protein of unknown function (DUF1488)